MKILIISNFSTRIESDRFVYIGEMLLGRGHLVTLLTSDFNHDQKEHIQNVENCQLYKTSIILLHEPGYPNNINLKRLWSHYQWGKNVEKYLKTHERPDVVYCAIPSLTAGVRAARFCARNGIRFIIDVQDLWPEAFVMAVKNKLLQKAFMPFEWYVNKIYSAADGIVAVSETYANRALCVNKKTGVGLSVFLGNDGQLFDEAFQSQVIEKPAGVLQLCYIGTLGYSYDIKCAIDALAIYSQNQNMPPMQFVVMGRGPLQDEFEGYAKKRNVNALFTGALPYSEMVARMCNCDILINPIMKGAAQSITNKVGDYALAGLPVVSTQENVEYRDLVEKYQCGINCECGNAQDVAKALIKLAKDKKLRQVMGNNARILGVEKFDRRFTYGDIVRVIEQE